MLAPNEADRSEEDAKRDREHGALAQERARTAGDGDGGEGHEVPGGQLHFAGISYGASRFGGGQVLPGNVEKRRRFTCRRSYDTQQKKPNFYR